MMVQRISLIFAALAFVISAGQCEAANIVMLPDLGIADFIDVVGVVEPGDAKRFDELAAQHPAAQVILDVSGGDLTESIAIGREIRAKKLSTLVQPDVDCVSVCALLWLSGAKKTITSPGNVSVSPDETESAPSSRQSIRAYLAELGASPRLIEYVTSAIPEPRTWLDAAKAAEFGILFRRAPGAPGFPMESDVCPGTYPYDGADSHNRWHIFDYSDTDVFFVDPSSKRVNGNNVSACFWNIAVTSMPTIVDGVANIEADCTDLKFRNLYTVNHFANGSRWATSEYGPWVEPEPGSVAENRSLYLCGRKKAGRLISDPRAFTRAAIPEYRGGPLAMVDRPPAIAGRDVG